MMMALRRLLFLAADIQAALAFGGWWQTSPAAASTAFLTHSSSSRRIPLSTPSPTTALASTFAADGSEYSSRDSDDRDDDADDRATYNNNNMFEGGSGEEGVMEDDTPTVELSPVPMSKNSGNRFVSFVWDRLLDQENRDALDLFYDRIELTEEHVMYCRKANLYNETFNTQSMVDVIWSLPILSSDLQRVIGHAMCMESTQLEYIHDFMRKEPIIRSLTDGKLDDIPLFRWRHLKDYTLRMDDGRFGFPCLCLGMDFNNDNEKLRRDLHKAQLEYLIRSERVIATGPLHLPTQFKDDPSSHAAGDLLLFNAPNREAAIDFVEAMPYAQGGLYQELRVHFYNTLDVTGKFVSENILEAEEGAAPCADMKEAMEYWGYPVHDHQTPWLNW